MGSSSSKAARTAGNAARKYPTRSPSATTTRAPAQAPSPPPPQHDTTAIPPSNSESNTQIDLDGRDPGLASRLHSLGAVTPNPHFSPSSFSPLDPQRHTSQHSPSRNPQHDFPADMMQAPPPSAFASAFPDPRDNPALRLLEARQRIQELADRELESIGKRGFKGRSMTDAATIQLALMRLRRGETAAKIEDAYGLERGKLGLLGKGIVETVQ